MRKTILAIFTVGIFLTGICLAGDAAPDQEKTAPTPEQASAPDEPANAAEEPGNWEKFKEGVKQAGGAAAASTKDAAGKTADAVVRGAEKTGSFFSETYDDAKRYLHEKTAD